MTEKIKALTLNLDQLRNARDKHIRLSNEAAIVARFHAAKAELLDMEEQRSVAKIQRLETQIASENLPQPKLTKH